MSDAPANEFDVIVIGAGPAGLTAGLYAARGGLSVAVFERISPGGQLAQTSEVENYPGFPNGAEGWQLAFDMQQQALNFGVKIITGFTGSPIWRYLYSFPQTTEQMVEDGFDEIVRLWTPILDEFKKHGVVFALEVHPGEIAFDYYSTKKLLEKFADRPEFGLNFDPSHLIWQGIKPHLFLQDFIDRVYHVHMKDAAVTLDGRSGLLGSHIDFGDLRRGWNFRSLGHGDVNFEEIIRVLNAAGYDGPLSVEWEDSGMDRIDGATEAAAFVRKVDFKPSAFKFDDAIAN